MDSSLSTVGIRLANCAKTFPDGTRALDPVQLEIQPGETVVLLGPSGCGKTTMLRIIAGLEQPDDGGQVFFGEQDVTALPIEQRHVGMVFQSYALFPNMSVAENIAYGLKVRGMAVAEKGEAALRIRDGADRGAATSPAELGVAGPQGRDEIA